MNENLKCHLCGCIINIKNVNKDYVNYPIWMFHRCPSTRHSKCLNETPSHRIYRTVKVKI
jgi:hypothetical protein